MKTQCIDEEDTEVADFTEDNYSATDTVKGKGWGALILGLCLLPTPLLGLGVALVALGVAFLAITPKLQALEDEVDERIADEQSKGRSGCGWMIWFCLVGVALLVGVGVVLTAGALMVGRVGL